jgi:glutamate-1-semialdehyde 2,1-aminomutase
MGNSWAERALSVFPGGSNGEFGLPPELVPVLRRGQGARVWDTQGKEYIDFSMAWGAALTGHAHPDVLHAMQSRLADGLGFAHINEASLELAETLRSICPAVEQIRFCASGTEATLYCVRIARGYTSRPAILRFEGGYHGAHDIGVTSLFPRDDFPFPRPNPSCAGVSAGTQADILVAPFNDLAQTTAIVEQHAERIAGIVVEPLQRCVTPVPGFLQGLRELASHHRIVLIFDEVVTGFRLALGGAQEYYGVIPDLVAYGKALGGGAPLGAFGGHREMMALVEESRLGTPSYVWSASSSGGNPISASASSAALRIYQSAGTYPKLHELGAYFRQQLRHVFESAGVQAQILGDGALAQFALTPEPISDYRSSRHRTPERARNIMLGLFAKGIFLNPMGTKLYLSLAHTQAECDAFCDRLAETLAASPVPAVGF